MPSRQTLDLLQSQTSQQLPCRDSRYHMSGSVATVLKRTKLTAAVVGAAAAKYLLLIATNAYLVALRARGAPKESRAGTAARITTIGFDTPSNVY